MNINIHNPQSRVLVTGGAGYIGSLLVRALLVEGYNVTVLDPLFYDKNALEDVKSKILFIQGDTRDKGRVIESLKGVDMVVHLGEIVGEPSFFEYPELCYNLNYTASAAFVLAAKNAKVKRFIYMSSCSVYGFSKSEISLTENSPVNPIGNYGLMKVKMEEYIRSVSDSSFQPIILRLGTAYGLSFRPRFDLAVNTITAHATVEQKITIQGADNWRPHVSVNDVVQAVVLTLKAPHDTVEGEVFNVGDEKQNLTMRDIGIMVQKIIPSAALNILEENSQDGRSYRVSFDKIQNVLGFTALHSIEAAVLELTDHLSASPNYKASKYSNVATLVECKGKI